MFVIHDADQGLLLGDVRQQAQDSQGDQEAIRRRTGADPERSSQRIALRGRETVEAIEHRRAQLVQCGKRQLHLRLDTSGALDPAARRLPDQVVQERRLAHARFAADHQRPTLPGANRFDEAIEYVALAAPAPQPRPKTIGSTHLHRRRLGIASLLGNLALEELGQVNCYLSSLRTRPPAG